MVQLQRGPCRASEEGVLAAMLDQTVASLLCIMCFAWEGRFWVWERVFFLDFGFSAGQKVGVFGTKPAEKWSTFFAGRGASGGHQGFQRFVHAPGPQRGRQGGPTPPKAAAAAEPPAVHLLRRQCPDL